MNFSPSVIIKITNRLQLKMRCKIIFRVATLIHGELHNLHTFAGCKKRFFRISSKPKPQEQVTGQKELGTK